MLEFGIDSADLQKPPSAGNHYDIYQLCHVLLTSRSIDRRWHHSACILSTPLHYHDWLSFVAFEKISQSLPSAAPDSHSVEGRGKAPKVQHVLGMSC